MDYKKNIQTLEYVLAKSNDITIENNSDPNFIIWQNLTIRSLERIFGAESFELKQFLELDFYFRTPIRYLDIDYSAGNLTSFRRDFKIAVETFKGYIQEFEMNYATDEQQNNLSFSQPASHTINKVFISHSSADKEIVEDLVDLLENLGLNHNQIFCSSIQEYGIELGENFLERLKNELDNNALVLFILSDNFYKSPVCLCEMGATWISTKAHIPILIPPLDFKDIKGVIPLTQGFIISDKTGLNQFKDKIQQLFALNLNASTWERKRDRFLKNISEKINPKSPKASSGFGYRKAIR